MISQHLAQALRDAGVRWRPSAGDRFVIPQPELDGELFTLSEMTIEAREYPTGTILGFNGTTEWALDSVAQDDALWMPREDQLRELLGSTFVSLRRTETSGDGASGDGASGDSASGDAAFVVVTRDERGADGEGGRTEREFAGPTAAEAYGQALLALVRQAVAPVGAPAPQ